MYTILYVGLGMRIFVRSINCALQSQLQSSRPSIISFVATLVVIVVIIKYDDDDDDDNDDDVVALLPSLPASLHAMPFTQMQSCINATAEHGARSAQTIIKYRGHSIPSYTFVHMPGTHSAMRVTSIVYRMYISSVF